MISEDNILRKESGTPNIKDGVEIGVLGHWPIDMDSYVSAYLMVAILRFQGKKARVILHDNLDDKFIHQLIRYKIPLVLYRLLSEVSDMDIILVDNNVPPPEVADRVIQTIDHHSLDVGYIKNEGDIIRNSSSTALTIYESFKDIYYFSKEERRLIYVTTALDTCGFLSSKFLNEDSIKELVESKIYFFDFEESDYLRTIKHHNIEGVSFDSAYITKVKKFDFSEQIKFIDNEETYLFLINFLEDKLTIAIFKFNNELHYINYDHLASRGAEVIPDISKIIKRAP